MIDYVDEEETIARFHGEAGTMIVVDTLRNFYDYSTGCGSPVQQEMVKRELKFEGVEVARSDAIIRFMAVKDFYWAQKLLRGWDLDCPVLRAALAKLETAVVIEDTPDILSLTKDFINGNY